ncbi:MAG: NTP transferase domain-containing protein [Planctomycetes bacterium]|nr:NTP transferase domain-containing protein [Planctomycetota bacterium]
MKPTLVILAAGMGSRYGGMKQLERVGPSGETIMDYSIYDALRAGFGKALFVIREDMEDAFKETIGRRYEQHIPVAYAFQRLEDLPAGYTVPPGREKPWGTGHAVLAVAGQVSEPFAVVNADDFYGANSFAALGRFLQENDTGDVPTYAMVGFTLRETLSDSGTVNRGCCRCTPDGWLVEITEIINIEPYGAEARYVDESGNEQVLSGDTRVSMNTWGFQPVFFEHLRERFDRFLEQCALSETGEFHLPTGVQELIRASRARVRVLPTPDHWVGVTHKEDQPRVIKMIRELVSRGDYPRKLWD